MSNGFTKEWLEAHKAKRQSPKKGMPNDRATKERAKAELARIEANRKSLEQGPHKARKPTKTVIGIDPGVKTGVGVYIGAELVRVETTSIIEAIEIVKSYSKGEIMVYVEDARMATYGRRGKDSLAQAQGAGSIKRDCKIWEQELTRLSIPHKMVRPNKQSNQIAENKNMWQKITGWTKRSSEHARDAVMIAKRHI